MLANLPITLYCAWQQHADSLLREATLAALEDNGVAADDFPLAAQALGSLATAAAGAFTLRDEAVANADLPLELPSDALAWFPILRDLLARATTLAHSGKILTPAALPEITALRNWVCDEVARQAAGLPPERWRGGGCGTAQLDVVVVSDSG